MNKVKKMAAFTLLAGFLKCSISAEQAVPPLKFEVASIKRDNARQAVDARGFLLPPQFQFTPGGLFEATNVTVADILTLLHPGKHQLEGGPAWLNSDRFDILAHVEPGRGAIPAWRDSGHDQWLEMVGNLLRDRFALKTHEDVRERSVFILTFRGSRPELEEHTEGTASSADSDGRGRLRFYGVSMSSFARYLSSVMQTAVVDGTGMTGLFDFEVDPYRFGADALDNRINANRFADLMLYAIQELGFELQRHKTAVAYTVIDSIEQPTEN